ncbi:hypothetical protein ES703_121409 [subsurface metagenome]
MTQTMNSPLTMTSPSLPQPDYDVLRPGPEVQIIGFTVAGQKMTIEEGETGETREGDVIVTGEFMVWVEMLQQEITRLRNKTSENW